MKRLLLDTHVLLWWLEDNQGGILGFLNADDYYEPKVFNRGIEIFKTLPEPSLLVGNCNVWDNDGNLWFVSSPKKISLTNILLEKYLESFPMNPAGYFYHASLHKRIGLYKVEDHFCMDMDFILRAIQAAHVKYMDETWGNYRYLENTKTFNDGKSGNNVIRTKAMIREYRKNLPIIQQMRIIVQTECYRNLARIYMPLRMLFGRVSKIYSL